MKYFHVTEGQIDDGPRVLPKAWRNVSGLDRSTPEGLAALGWVPQEVVGFDPFDPATQTRTGPVNEVQADRVVSTYTVTDKDDAVLIALRQSETKAEAYRRIIAIVPEWKQRNLTAQATLLLKIGTANWTQEQQSAWDAGAAIWEQVATIRAKSDALESDIAGMNAAALKALDVTANEHWTD
jgi:hypothetical protein